jgi:hypothetical protein
VRAAFLTLNTRAGASRWSGHADWSRHSGLYSRIQEGVAEVEVERNQATGLHPASTQQRSIRGRG